MKQLFLIAASLLLSFSACKDDTDPDVENADTSPKEDLIQINTSFGRMIMWLHPETPLHRANFLKLTREGFYNQTEYHRIVKDFVIQGGDPNSKDADRTNDGTGGPGYTVKAEIDSSTLKHTYGAVGAARLPDGPNPTRASNGSQFYIVVDQNGEHGLDGAYTVLGQILDGMDVAEQIESQSVGARSEPLNRIPMTVSAVVYSHNQLKDSFNFVP